MSALAKRPGLVTVAAVILFLVGAWSVFGGLCGGGAVAVMAFLPEPPPNADNKARLDDPMASVRFLAKEVPGYYAIATASLAVGMLIGLVEIGCGFGVLRLSGTARLLAILITLLKLVFSAAGHGYNLIYVLPAQQRFHELNPHIPGGEVAAIASYAGLAVGIFLQLAVVITILALLFAPSVRQAFAEAAKPADPTDEELPRRRDAYEED